MGNTCKPMDVSFQCMTKSTTNKKKKKKKKKVNEKALGEKSGCPGILHLDISAYFPPCPHLFSGFITTLCAGGKKKKDEVPEADTRGQIQTGEGRDG